MRLGSFNVFVVVCALVCCAACTDIKNPEYFQDGVDSDVGGDSDQGEDTGQEQPSGDPCVPDGGVWGCDPLTGDGCPSENTACDHGVSGGVAGFYCYTDCTEVEGAPCMTVESGGPWCAAGLTCLDGVCVMYCCSSADCDGESCVPLTLENVTGGALGTCPADEIDTDTDTETDTST
ncbi:MAG: hypothetical protein JRF63_12865 [Deltaproteobacteria bacterium]|nr:hypothetical protein [Deltaproteobacteria bacterium]